MSEEDGAHAIKKDLKLWEGWNESCALQACEGEEHRARKKMYGKDGTARKEPSNVKGGGMILWCNTR